MVSFTSLRKRYFGDNTMSADENTTTDPENNDAGAVADVSKQQQQQEATKDVGYTDHHHPNHTIIHMCGSANSGGLKPKTTKIADLSTGEPVSFVLLLLIIHTKL